MQAIGSFNAFSIIQNRLKQLEDDWLDFKTAHRVLATRLMHQTAVQDFFDEGTVPNLDHAIEMVKELRKHRLPLFFCRENSDRYVAQLTPIEFRGLFRIDRIFLEC
jgi:hypothetical protein